MKYKICLKYVSYDDDDIPHDEPDEVEVEADNPHKAFSIAVKMVSEKHSGSTNALNYIELENIEETESGSFVKIIKRNGINVIAD